MKRYFLLSISFLLIVHISIKSQELPLNLDIKNILSKSSEIDSSFISDIRYIFLETNEDCLIGSPVLDIRCVNGFFYVNDLTGSRSILVFDKSGKFEYKINKYGRGPGEYTNANKFDVDNEGNIYVLNNILNSGNNYLIRYSKQGKNYNNLDLGCKTSDFMIIDDDRALITYPFYPNKSKFSIGELNFKDNSVKKIHPYREYYDNAPLHFGSGPFFKSAKTVYFTPYFSNVIYKAKDQIITLFAQFDSSFIPSEDIVRNFKVGDGLQNFHKLISKDNYIFSVDHIFETSDLLTFSFLCKNGNITYIISKSTGKDLILRANSFNNKNYFSQNIFIGTIDDYLVSILFARTYISPGWKDKVRQSTLDKSTKEKLLSMNLTANPVLILFKIKPF